MTSMNRAWGLVNTLLGRERDSLKAMNMIPGVKEAHLVLGQYDIVLLIEASSMKQLEDIISWNIRVHKTVCNTVTMGAT
jgi:DNA-binding Lrp family transcriptional regulator